MLSNIFDILANNGINTYFVGQHRGECGVPYVVVKDAGSTAIPGISLNRSIFEMIVFYPFGRFDQMEDFMAHVKDTLRGLANLHDARYRSPVIVDEEKRAYTSTIRYWGYQAHHK